MLVAVAMDAQGGQAAAPYVQAARATYPALVDADNALGTLLGFKVVPNGVFIDERGVLRKVIQGDFEVSSPKTIMAVEAFLAEATAKGAVKSRKAPRLSDLEKQAQSGDVEAKIALGDAYNRLQRYSKAEEAFRHALHQDSASVAALFGMGVALLHQGHTLEAVASWRAALKRAPENYVIRKQIWVVEHPEKFYPVIDWDWQRRQPRD